MHRIRQVRFANTKTVRWASKNSRFFETPHFKCFLVQGQRRFKSQASRGIVSQKYDESRSREYAVSSEEGENNSIIRVVSSRKDAKEILHDVVWYFLPRSYPASVAKGYDRFAIGQFVSTTLGTTCGVLSMQSMLFAIGAGSGSMPLAATLNWIIKDGLGQFGGIVFASFVNNQFDADPKRWRMISGISMDSASFLELLTPLAPAYFLPIAAVANVGKNISFLSASASRAAIHKSFAIHENLADITAKTGSQCIVGSLLGTSLGLSIAASVGQDYASVLTAFAVCSAMSLTATYYSLKDVTLTTLSLERLDCIVDDYVRKGGAAGVLTPKDVREREVYLGNSTNLISLNIGADIDEVTRSQGELTQMLDLFSREEYLLGARTDDTAKEAAIHLLFKENVSTAGMLKGLFNAYMLRSTLSQKGYSPENSREAVRRRIMAATGSISTEPLPGLWNHAVVEEAYLKAQDKEMGDKFVSSLLKESKQGQSDDRDVENVWTVDGLLLESRVARVVI